MRPETFSEQVSRIRQMACEDSGWDLSVNDQAALGSLLKSHAALIDAANAFVACAGTGTGMWTDDERAGLDYLRAAVRLDRALARENRDAADRIHRSRHEWAPMAPVPVDPKTCRWCGGTTVNAAGFCSAGCEPNESAPYTGHCHTCERQFKTGSRENHTTCWGCDQKDKRAVEAAMRENPSRGFTGKKDPIRPLRMEHDREE